MGGDEGRSGVEPYLLSNSEATCTISAGPDKIEERNLLFSRSCWASSDDPTLDKGDRSRPDSDNNDLTLISTDSDILHS